MIIIIIQLHVFSVTYSLLNGLFVIIVFIFMQPGTDIQEVLKVKTFSEPRLIIFVNKSNPTHHSVWLKGLSRQRTNSFSKDNFSISEGIISLIATYYCYYISYPKSLPAQSFLLFVQILLKEKAVSGVKRSSKYSKLVNFILS